MKKAIQLITLLIPALVFGQYQPQVIWDRSGLQDSSSYGTQILPLGDQNDDGVADWAVTAWGNGQGQRSYVEFFHGADSLPTGPFHTFHFDTTIYRAAGARGTGDFNGDGYVDWLLIQSRHPNGTIVDVGVFFGGPTGSDTPQVTFTTSFQTVTYPLGDFNADNMADLFFYDFNTDEAWICYGGDPMDTMPDWTLHQPPAGLLQSIPRAIGDFTGDGASDFLCFDPNSDSVAIFLGGAQPDTIPDYLWSGVTHGAIGGLQDVTNDGRDELVFRSNNSAFVHFGQEELSSTPDYTLNFSCSAGLLNVFSAGDFNHDNYNDIILLTSSCIDNMFGSLTLHLGHPWLNADPVMVIDGWTPPLDLIGIYSAAGLGDVNGDSIDDIAIGAWDDFAYLGWRGRCVIIAGDDSLEVSVDEPQPELPEALAISAYPNPFNSSTTIKLTAPLTPELTILSIYNVLGQEVQHKVIPPFPNEYKYEFNAGDLTTGLYLVHVQSGNLQTTRRLMLLR